MAQCSFGAGGLGSAMYLSPRRTLSARASGCLTRFGWAYVSGAEPMGSGGWLVICRDLPERRIRTLSPTALLENSASVAEDETVREVAEGWLPGGALREVASQER